METLVRKLKDLPRAWKNGDESDPNWEKDRLIDRLESDGHRTISVERAVVIIEQCEEGDRFPTGWSQDPLKLTVHPDPDAGFGRQPDELYIHAGRSGLMDVHLRRPDGKRFKLIPLEEDSSNAGILAASDLARVDAITELVRGGMSGYYQTHHLDKVIDRDRDGKEIRGECTTASYDEKLMELGTKVLEAMAEYRRHLESRPELFRRWKRGES